MTITYKQIRTLRTRGPIEQLPDREVDGALLVGQQPAIEFEDRHSEAGWDLVALYPAFHDGAQCWLELRRWCAAHSYCAAGVQERVVPFEDGVQIFLERGVFALELGGAVVLPVDGVTIPIAAIAAFDTAIGAACALLPGGVTGDAAGELSNALYDLHRACEPAEIEPPPGYVERAVERARREGVLPPTS